MGISLSKPLVALIVSIATVSAGISIASAGAADRHIAEGAKPAVPIPAPSALTDPLLGQWGVCYGDCIAVTITINSGTYDVTSEAPTRLGNGGVPTSSCYLPAGTLLASFSGSSLAYTGQQGLWYNQDCSFGLWDSMTLNASSTSLTLYQVNANGYGTDTYTKLPTVPQTTAGGTPGDNNTSCSGCPVNTATGEFHRAFTDLAVPGRGMALNLTRTYSTNLAAQNSPFGHGWTDSYDMSLLIDPTSGNVTVNQPNGSAVTFLPNGSGGFVGPSSDFATLTYNSTTKLYSYAHTTGDSYVFNSTGQLTQAIDRNSNTTTLAYSGGKLATVTDPGGRTLTFSYRTNGDVSSVTDSGGRTVSYLYGGGGNLLQVSNAGGGVTKFAYDTSHRMLTMTDPRGGVSTLTYNSAGQVATWTDPMGRKTTYTYAGTVGATETTSESDARGDVTQWNYNNLELTSKTLGYGTASAATTSYAYDPTTLGLTSVTDPDGHTTTSTYDANGNLLSQTDPLGRKTTYTYNSFDEVLTKSDPLGVTTTNTYDNHGNLLTTSTPIGSSKATTTYTYSPAGLPLTMKNPDNKTSTFTYDNYGDRLTSRDPLGNTTTDTYTILGEETSETTPLGHETTNTYDPFGDLLSTTDPLGNVTTNTYDTDQNPLTTTDPKGDVTTKTYDANNEVTSVVATNPSKVTLTSQTTTYDAAGNVASQTNGDSNTTTYAYDPLNRVTSSTDPLGRTTSYSYDPAGNRLTVTDPSGRVTTTAYDADNEPTSVTYSDGVTPDVTYAYDADGRRISMTDGTGTTTYTYDNLGRVTSDTQGAGRPVKYRYDLASNLTTLTYEGHAVTRRLRRRRPNDRRRGLAG